MAKTWMKRAGIGACALLALVVLVILGPWLVNHSPRRRYTVTAGA